ncbi:hypothetical protein SeMB42_g02767 [Synchytrium endobioticum]|uniref:UBC core domain-containing protein n=1 Tax=Synchytrium endobioticum TaxID=286115 RepID=A0A507CSU0_9FUNG|nr:hypothetical protein SeLEV6574_g05702 [Synchytrium endobioticum]TPX48993.1 hypothetical protein SeMB42_g02767 [Synchytrium endobioticum]
MAQRTSHSGNTTATTTTTTAATFNPAPAMSRAVLLLIKQAWLLEREVDQLPWGISCNMIANNYFHWNAVIHGLLDTPWERGIFKLELLFPENWNEEPPTVYFVTVPFHPNINLQTGRPCVDFLDDVSKWSPRISIVQILVHLQAMLNNPTLDNPVNTAAAHIYLTAPRLYTQLLHDCVVASRRIDAGLPPHDEPAPATYTPLLPPAHRPKTGLKDSAKRWKIHKVDFADYYQKWQETATTVPATFRGPDGLAHYRAAVLAEHAQLNPKKRALKTHSARTRGSQLQTMFKKYYNTNSLHRPKTTRPQSALSGWHSEDEAGPDARKSHHDHTARRRTASLQPANTAQAHRTPLKSNTCTHTRVASMTRTAILKDIDELEDDLLEWASNLDEDDQL